MVDRDADESAREGAQSEASQDDEERCGRRGTGCVCQTEQAACVLEVFGGFEFERAYDSKAERRRQR